MSMCGSVNVTSANIICGCYLRI